jgi:L-alanine-DL-glutamate epimerase-like enolase superfamily enzyme
MKIVDIKTQTFNYKTNIVPDSEGHTHPGPEHDTSQTILTIVTDDGAEGYAFGVNRSIVEHVIKPATLGEDAFYRERLWQRLKNWQRIHRNLTDNVIGVVDMALWDLAGRYFGQPVYKLLGGYRDKVLAYASTMCGDETPGGLSSPDDYARFAEWCMKRGYKAFKLHTWMPPIEWAPDPKMDVKACAAVREAVGDDVPLMLDCYHDYSREQALYIGRELEKLNYHWFEEPMNEHSTSSYVWLAEQLDIPIVGPETAEGKMYTRGEWILRGASDILRGGVGDVGGITPLMKIVHLAESFGMTMEVHGGGAGNLHVLGAMGIPGEFYERGLLHPFVDYEAPEPWLNSRIDAMDDEGYVHLPQGPGLGYEVNFDYIEANTIKTDL